MIASELLFGKAVEWGVGWVFEEPLPGCYVARYCSRGAVSILCQYSSRSQIGRTEDIVLQALERHLDDLTQREDNESILRVEVGEKRNRNLPRSTYEANGSSSRTTRVALGLQRCKDRPMALM